MNRPDLSAPASQGCPTAGFVGTTMSPGLTPATFPNTGVPPNQSMQQSPTFTMQARMPFSSGPRMGYPGDAYTRPSPLPIFNMATPGSPAPGPGPVFFRVEPRPTSNFQQFRHEVAGPGYGMVMPTPSLVPPTPTPPIRGIIPPLPRTAIQRGQYFAPRPRGRPPSTGPKRQSSRGRGQLPGIRMGAGRGATGTPAYRGPSQIEVQAEEMAYREKIAELRKYSGFLSCLIEKTKTESGAGDQLAHLKRLRDIVTDPAVRVPLKVLLHCEHTLKQLTVKELRGMGSRHVAPSPAPSPFSQGSMVNTASVASAPAPVNVNAGPPAPEKDDSFKEIEDLYMEAFRNQGVTCSIPGIESTLKSLVGHRTHEDIVGGTNSVSDRTEKKPDGLANIIPVVLRREMKILDRTRFKVTLGRTDPLSSSVMVRASLVDASLPVVPPLLIHVPADYPDSRPFIPCIQEDYVHSPFLKRIGHVFMSKAHRIEQRYVTVLELLHFWEISVRQALREGDNFKLT